MARDRTASSRSTSSSSSRARRRSSSAHLEHWLETSATSSRPTSRSSPTPASSSRATAGHHLRPARAGVLRDRRGRDRGRPPLRASSAAPSRTRRTPWRRSSRASRAPTAGSAIRVSTTTSCRSSERIGPRSRPSPSTRRRTRHDLGLPAARRRGRVHDARAPRGTPDPRRQRDLGRLPGGGEQDDHPRPRPRQGQLPAGDRAGPGQDLRGVPGVRRGDRAARRDHDASGTSVAGCRA